MKNKIFFVLLVFCLLKLYHIADRSLYFSPNLLINSFHKNAGEKESLLSMSDEVISIRDYLQERNITKFGLSDEILKEHENFYMRIIEFNYPIKMSKNSPILFGLEGGDGVGGCDLLDIKNNIHIYECK